ncbi:MAG: hypothetical protein QM783_17300 [Phycisphaerales bacterium]
MKRRRRSVTNWRAAAIVLLISLLLGFSSATATVWAGAGRAGQGGTSAPQPWTEDTVVRAARFPCDGWGEVGSEREGWRNSKRTYRAVMQVRDVAPHRTLSAAQWRDRVLAALADAPEYSMASYMDEFNPGDVPTMDMITVHMEGAGWPLESAYVLVATFHPILTRNEDGGSGADETIASNDERSIVPRVTGTVLWGPMTLNALLFAAAWALMLAAPTVLFGAARRHHRKRHGRCPDCNYDRAGIATETPCPECGKAPAFH